MNISSSDLQRIEQRRMWRSNALAIAAIGGFLALNGLMTAWDKQAVEKMAASPANRSQKRMADSGAALRNQSEAPPVPKLTMVIFGKEQR